MFNNTIHISSSQVLYLSSLIIPTTDRKGDIKKNLSEEDEIEKRNTKVTNQH